ncbi:MAG: hypothetical protein VYA55_19675 [Pseudomonadota bacterium]|nr:hypothetical protein [Pseudomonadota bacterium]
MTRAQTLCVYGLLAAALVACGASLAPVWQLSFSSQYNHLLQGADEHSLYVLRYDDNTPTLYQLTRDGGEPVITPLSLPSTEILGRLGQQVWVADDDYVDYTARDLLRAQALDLDTLQITPALPDALRSGFSGLRGYLEQTDSVVTGANGSLAISGQAIPLGGSTELPFIAIVHADGRSHHSLLEGDILYHSLEPLPRSPMFALHILYSEDHFNRTGFYNRVVFYDAELTPLQTVDLPQRLYSVVALPDRLYAPSHDEPRYLEIHTDGRVSPSERKGQLWSWNDHTQFLFHEDFFYALEVSEQGRMLCRFDYQLQNLGCFTPRDRHWTAQAQMLEDGTLVTAEQHRSIVLNGVTLSLDPANASLLSDLDGWGYEQQQMFYRFYSPQGELLNEIAAPPFRAHGKLISCHSNPDGYCVWEAVSETTGTCSTNTILPYSQHEVLASETLCQPEEHRGALTLWNNRPR